jgi:hypothetical protein
MNNMENLGPLPDPTDLGDLADSSLNKKLNSAVWSIDTFLRIKPNFGVTHNIDYTIKGIR